MYIYAISAQLKQQLIDVRWQTLVLFTLSFDVRSLKAQRLNRQKETMKRN